MDSIIRGTTPTINVTIPGLAEIEPNEIWFSFKSGNQVFTYTKSKTDSGISVAGETISKHFEQAETLAFDAGILYMQVRLLDQLEMAYATPWLSFMVEEIIQDGVMDLVVTSETIDIEATVTAMYNEFTDIRDDLKSLAMSVAKKVEGTTVSASDAVSFDAPSLQVAFEPTQSGSGVPSSTNIRPFVGKNSCSIVVREGEETIETTEASAASVVHYYMASDSSYGITRNSYGWTTDIEAIDDNKQYLWWYSRSYDVDGTLINITNPAIILSSGTAIADITDYYLASQESSGITPDTAGWTTEIQDTSLAKNYLWNYKVITFPDDTAEELDTKIISALKSFNK